jgi:predicted ArsR family transcriptional regulator
MPEMPWDDRFFASTRGRIVTLLRRASRTVEELAQALELSDNAVRAHLATLERDGLVQQQGVRRSSRRPAYAYTLTPHAQQALPRAYRPVLRHALDVLAERLPPPDLEAVLREVGRRLAAERALAAGDLVRRVAAAAAVLNELGGLAEVETDGGVFLVRSYSCPLAAVVPGHPEVCRLVETLLSALVGVPVRERCDRSEPLRCSFEVFAT